MKKKRSLPRTIAGALFVLAAVAVPLYALDLFPFKIVHSIEQTMPMILVTHENAQTAETTLTIEGKLIFHPLERQKSLQGTFAIEGYDFPRNGGEYSLQLYLTPSSTYKGYYEGSLSYLSFAPSDWPYLGRLYVKGDFDEVFLIPPDGPSQTYVAPAETPDRASRLLDAWHRTARK